MIKMGNIFFDVINCNGRDMLLKVKSENKYRTPEFKFNRGFKNLRRIRLFEQNGPSIYQKSKLYNFREKINRRIHFFNAK
jgi:hypothetical protein